MKKKGVPGPSRLLYSWIVVMGYVGESQKSLRSCRRTKARAKNKGLTIIETMLALILLSLLIVGVLGLLGSLLVASTKSTDSTAGTFVGQYILDSAALTGPPDREGGVVEGTKALLTHEEEHPLNFRYRATWTKVAESASYSSDGVQTASQFGSVLYHVEVVVFWMIENEDDGRAEGGGRRTVTLERLVNYTDRTVK